MVLASDLLHCCGPAGRQKSWWQERLVSKATHLVMREQKEEIGRGQGKERTCLFPGSEVSRTPKSDVTSCGSQFYHMSL